MKKPENKVEVCEDVYRDLIDWLHLWHSWGGCGSWNGSPCHPACKRCKDEQEFEEWVKRWKDC